MNLVARKEVLKSLAVIVPCYNEQEVLPELFKRLEALNEKLKCSLEVLLIDDGSCDQTWQLIESAHKNNSLFKGLKLSRNFGHQIALSCGLEQVKTEAVVIIDGDLQDPPELIPDMIELWQKGYDVIYGQRIVRDEESILKKGFAYLFYRLINFFGQTEIPLDTGDFRMMDRRVVSAVNQLSEQRMFLRGMVSWVGFSQTALPYRRPQRAAGKTKYSFKKSFQLAVDAFASFSYAPLRISTWLGFALIIIALCCSAFFMNFTVTNLILLLSGVQLVALGIIGEYLGRIYEEVKRRPLYYIEKRLK